MTLSREAELYRRLRTLDEVYNSLRRVWEGYKEANEGAEAMAVLKNQAPSHQVILSEADEVRFSYLGVEWYARFLHTLKCGMIEYGVLCEGAREVDERRASTLVIEFDKLGNADAFGEPWELGNPVEARWIHKWFLAEVAPKALENGLHLADPVDPHVAGAPTSPP